MSSFPVSGTVCVAALCRAGYGVVETCTDRTILRGPHGRLAVVPEGFSLAPDVVDGVLSAIDISYERFIQLLSESPTQPDLSILGEHENDVL